MFPLRKSKTIGLIKSGIIAELIFPVAPASKSANNVIPSSPSKGPSINSPPSYTSTLNLAAACAHSILKHFTISISLAILINSGTGKSTPDKGAS